MTVNKSPRKLCLLLLFQLLPPDKAVTAVTAGLTPPPFPCESPTPARQRCTGAARQIQQSSLGPAAASPEGSPAAAAAAVDPLPLGPPSKRNRSRSGQSPSTRAPLCQALRRPAAAAPSPSFMHIDNQGAAVSGKVEHTKTAAAAAGTTSQQLQASKPGP